MWFTKPKSETKVVLLNREATNLLIAEWRSDKNLCAAGANVLLDANVKLMLQVLENSHPAGFVMANDTPIEERAIHQARCEGYTLALANFRSLAKYETPTEPLIEEFADTET